MSLSWTHDVTLLHLQLKKPDWEYNKTCRCFSILYFHCGVFFPASTGVPWLVCVCDYVCLFLDVLLFILVRWPVSISCNGVRLRCQSERALIWKSERDGEMVAREMRRIRSRKRKSWKNVWMEKMSERTRCEEEDRKEAIHTGACSSCATMTPAAGPPLTSLSSLSGCSRWELVTPVLQGIALKCSRCRFLLKSVI